MTPQEAVSLINQTLRQVNTTADNHDLLREAVQTLAKLVAEPVSPEPSRDGATEEVPIEEGSDRGRL